MRMMHNYFCIGKVAADLPYGRIDAFYNKQIQTMMHLIIRDGRGVSTPIPVPVPFLKNHPHTHTYTHRVFKTYPHPNQVFWVFFGYLYTIKKQYLSGTQLTQTYGLFSGTQHCTVHKTTSIFTPCSNAPEHLILPLSASIHTNLFTVMAFWHYQQAATIHL